MNFKGVLTSSGINYYLHDFWEIEGDPRIAERPLFQGGPWATWSLIAFYIYFVKSLGPKLMKSRESLSLRKVMLVYNLLMICVNAWFFYQIVFNFNFGLEMNIFNFERPDKTDRRPKTMRIITLAYFFFISKLVDLIETVFFILRKKHNQVSNLHVYHHSVVPLMAHLAIKVSPVGGPATLFPLLNTLVHIVMYTYYALSALGPNVQKYLWWKKYITQIQLCQFILFAIHSLFFFAYEKGYPPIFKYLGLIQPPLFFYLFWSFYSSSYGKKHTNLKTQ